VEDLFVRCGALAQSFSWLLQFKLAPQSALEETAPFLVIKHEDLDTTCVLSQSGSIVETLSQEPDKYV
jgi:hypothetical protein